MTKLRTIGLSTLALLLALVGLGVALPAWGAALPQATATQPTTANTVNVALVEWAIEMPSEIPAGPTTFVVTNDGLREHNIEIENSELGVDEVFATNLQSGDTMSMTLDLQPGEYYVYCPIGSHADRGMELTLTVTAAAATPITVTASTALTDAIPTTATGMMTETSAMTETGMMTGTAMTPGVVIQLPESSVTAAEFDRAFLRAMGTFADRRGIPINATTITFFADLRARFLEQFATEQALLAEAKDRGIEISDDEAKDRIQPLKLPYHDDAAYQQRLHALGFANEQELIDFVKKSATIDALLTELSADIEVSDAEVRNFYEDNRELFRAGPGVILFLDQVQDQIRKVLRQQKLQERIAALRAKHSVEIFRGNLTPFEDLLLSELQETGAITGTSVMTGTSAITGTTGLTATEGMTIANPRSSIDVVPATQIPPIAITDTTTITDVRGITNTDTLTASEGMTIANPRSSIDVVPATQIPPIAITDTTSITDVRGMTNTGTLSATEGMSTTNPTAAITATETITDFSMLAEEPIVLVEDQAIPGGVVTVDHVFSNGPGWLVIHADNNGAPGAVLGHALVTDGDNEGVVVVIDETEATDTLWAMLHEDTGQLGIYEFPDGDPPVRNKGAIVMTPFKVLGAAESDTGAALNEASTMTETNVAADASLQVSELLGPAQLYVLEDDEYGAHLANQRGLALYAVNEGQTGNEETSAVTCTDACALIWPPALTDGTPEALSDQIDETLLGVVDSPIGPQATYGGHPLYTFTLDEEAGDTTGQGNVAWGVEWHLVAPDGALIPVAADQSGRVYTPRLRVADQELHAGLVTLLAVSSEGPGWMALFADDDGTPGVLLGETAVPNGATTAVTIEINPKNATDTVHAILYHDEGIVGAFEIPEPDEPAMHNGEIVQKTFSLDLTTADYPHIAVHNQQITNGQVTIEAVVSNGPGWVAIHNNAGGYEGDSTIGPIIGYSKVADGVNRHILVDIDMAAATGTLYAALYSDEGSVTAFGIPVVFEKPVMVDGEAMRQTFTVRDLTLSNND